MARNQWGDDPFNDGVPSAAEILEPEDLCIRCREHPRANSVFCVHCSYAVRAEVEHGLARLDVYLAAWAAFRQYEQANPKEEAHA